MAAEVLNARELSAGLWRRTRRTPVLKRTPRRGITDIGLLDLQLQDRLDGYANGFRRSCIG